MFIHKLDYYKMYYKRILVDLDDTICSTLDRDFENAKPIKSVISAINKFYNEGFEIIIQTARGQLSCNGNVLEADKKYREQIELWLIKNKVKYHELDFNKRLAQYYVDDKALTPEKFSKLKLNYLKGRSGQEVIRSGDYVYKTGKKVKNEIRWYKIVEEFEKPFKTPEIYSLIGETVSMQYIKPCKVGISRVEIKNILTFFKGIKGDESNKWNSYVRRVLDHTKINGFKLTDKIIKKLKGLSCLMDKEITFSHGDFSIDNIIKSKKGVYLIDSQIEDNLFSSYLLDEAKYLQSLNFKEDKRYKDYKSLYLNIENIRLLELTHWIRVLTYLEGKEVNIARKKIKKLINDIN